MKFKLKNIFAYVHNITLSVLFLLTLFATCVYVYEQTNDFEDYIKYYHVLPRQLSYNAGDSLDFFSFYESYKPVDIEWGETVWCDDGSGFVYADTASTKEPRFATVRVFPPRIKSIMNDMYKNNHKSDPLAEKILREYGESTLKDGFDEGSVVRPWRLNIEAPKKTSTCYARHKITIVTPYFHIIKHYELFSSPWEYKV